MYIPNGEKLELRSVYEPGERVMTVGGQYGVITGMIEGDNGMLSYGIQLDGEKSVRSCTEYEIAGSVVKDTSLKGLKEKTPEFFGAPEDHKGPVL